MTKQERRDKYLKKVFDTKTPDKDKVIAALNHAHETRRFEISLYWQRSLFFWGFMLTFFSGYFLLYTETEDEITFAVATMLSGLSLVGMFTAYAWYYLAKGAKTWQENWELHIDFLEDEITGKLHKTPLGKKGNFYSISSVLNSFIKVMIASWVGLFLISAYEFGTHLKKEFCMFPNCESLTVNICIILVSLILLALLVGLIFWHLQKCWRTSERTLGYKNADLKQLTLFQRKFPKIKF